MKRLLWKLIFTAIILNLTFFLFVNRDRFLRPFDPVYFSKLYSESQYVVGSGSQGIGDDGVYAFAGYYYLFQKGDPSQINFEHPPLGKYLIGLSIFLFNNENAINIFYFILILATTYKLGKIILKDNLLALSAVWLVSINRIMLENLNLSLLDLPFILFILLGLYFFIKGLNKPQGLYISSIFWGLVFSTKFFPALVLFFSLFTLIILFYKSNLLFTFLKSSLLIPIIYLVTHTAFFIYHPSLVEFLRHKKWMVDWWTGSPVTIGNIWRNIFTGSYIDSVGDLKFTRFWNLMIPTVAVLSLTRLRKNLLKEKNLPILTIYSFCIVYLIYLTFFNNGILKFYMHLYPLLVIMAIDNLRIIYKQIFRK